MQGNGYWLLWHANRSKEEKEQMEHLLNCHGEWNLFFTLLGSLPFVGAWFSYKKRGEQQLTSPKSTEGGKLK